MAKSSIGKKDIIFWFVLFYIVAIFIVFLLVSDAKSVGLTTIVAVLTPLVAAMAGLIGWSVNTDKKTVVATPTTPTPPVPTTNDPKVG